MLDPPIASPTTPAPADGATPAAGAELTTRALVIGCAIGALLVVMNVYMGLKTGFNDSGNLTASLLGLALLRAWPRRAAAAPLETNLVQTAASSAGAMCFACGLSGMVPALALGGGAAPAWALVAWGGALATIGILAAAWVRAQLLDAEKLPFPTGIATAELIRTLHADGAAAAARTRSLAGAFGVGALLTWFRDGKPAWLPQALLLPGRVGGASAAALSLGLAMSPMMAGVGALIGPHLGASVLFAAVVGWGVVAPSLVAHHVVAAPDYAVLIGWLLWPAVALMVASAVTALALDARRLRGSLRRQGGVSARLIAVAAAAAAIVVVVGWRALHIAPLWSLAALVLGVFLANVSTRAAGETDVNPIGTMGQLMQLGCGSACRDAATNLGVGGVVIGVGTPMTTSIWSYKAGALLGATPRRQLLAQLAGAAVGAVVGVAAYAVVVRALGLGSSLLPAPGALAMKAVADGVTKGAAALPPYAGLATAVAAALGVVLTLLGRLRATRLVPSPMAMGIGLLVPVAFSAAIFVGAVAAGLFQWRRPAAAERHLQPLAAGAIAGEAVTGVVVAALHVAGIL